MASEKGKVLITMGRLYKVSIDNTSPYIQAYGKPKLSIQGGTVDIYGVTLPDGSQPAALANMTLESKNSNKGGEQGFGTVPEYIAVVENTVTVTSILATGLILDNLGAIS